MSKRTPDAQVERFEHRPGGEFPRLGGMSRLGDEAQIPANQHHLLVNTRFSPGELSCRPGLVEDSNIGFEACVTGLIETQENSAFGGPVAGLLVGYAAGNGKDSSIRHWFYLNPEDDQVQDGEARPLITQAAPGAGVFVPESWSPVCGVRSHWWGTGGCGASAPFTGPLHPFDFQGNTCILGTIGSGPPYNMGLMGIVAPQDDSPGAVNVLTRFGNYYPGSSCIRREVVGGAILDVLYFYDLVSGQIMRFDGTTLNAWWDPTTALGTYYYWRLHCSGNEILLLGDTTVSISHSGTPTVTPTFARGVIYYQGQPGAPISPCTVVANYWNQDPGEQANRLIGFTGAARFRDNWYVTLDSSPGVLHVPSVTPYGQIITAPVTGAAGLAFVEAHTPGLPNLADYTDVAKRDFAMWVGYPTVWKDQLFYFAVKVLTLDANGSCFAGEQPPSSNPNEYQLGRFDASWDDYWLQLPNSPGQYFGTFTANWLLSNGDQLLIAMGGPNPGDERMWLYRSLAGIDQRTILDTTTGGVGGITIGTHSRYFAIPQDDAEETI